jgi:WD40 repeat protein
MSRSPAFLPRVLASFAALGLTAGIAFGQTVLDSPILSCAIPLHHLPRLLAGDAVSAAFSADDRRIAVGKKDGTVEIADVKSGVTLKVLKGHSEPAMALAFTPDGKRLASAAPSDVRLWDLADGKWIKAFPAKASDPFVSFSPDGSLLAFNSAASKPQMWDLHKGEEKPLRDAGFNVSAAAFSPDGKTLALGTSTGNSHGAVLLYDVALGNRPGEGVYDFAVYSGVLALRFLPDGKGLLTGHRHGMAYEIGPEAVTKGARRRILPTEKPELKNAFVYSDDGTRMALADGSGVMVYNVKDGSVVKEIKGEKAAAVALTSDGKSLAVIGADDVLTLWTLEVSPMLLNLRSVPAQEGAGTSRPVP